MRHLLAIAALLSVVSSGCYLGQGRTPKTVAEVISGTAVAVGTIALVSNHRGDEQQLIALMDGALIAAGVVGLLVNIATPTIPDASPNAPLHNARP
ncbi:MAG TPA: hypothetical protein VGM90_03580 [Kofleriaceae bacterium]|jgi:hypothetical protein